MMRNTELKVRIIIGVEYSANELYNKLDRLGFDLKDADDVNSKETVMKEAWDTLEFQDEVNQLIDPRIGIWKVPCTQFIHNMNDDKYIVGLRVFRYSSDEDHSAPSHKSLERFNLWSSDIKELCYKILDEKLKTYVDEITTYILL
jgi:hypothetical protein